MCYVSHVSRERRVLSLLTHMDLLWLYAVPLSFWLFLQRPCIHHHHHHFESSTTLTTPPTTTTAPPFSPIVVVVKLKLPQGNANTMTRGPKTSTTTSPSFSYNPALLPLPASATPITTSTYLIYPFHITSTNSTYLNHPWN